MNRDRGTLGAGGGIRWWLLGVVVVAGLLPWAARAQTRPPSLAVISEVAHQLNVITPPASSVGSHLSQGRQAKLDVMQGAFDTEVLLAARDALKSTGASVWLIAPIDSEFFDPLQDIVEGARVSIPDDLAQAMHQKGSDELLLFTRYSAPAAVELRNTTEGQGRLVGMGFYLQPYEDATNMDTLNSMRGYVAPFVYMRATLIDAKTGRVLRTATYTECRSMGGNMRGNAWTSTSSEQKANAIHWLVVKGVNQLIPELFAH
jgi:hypothetical protein